MDNRECMNACTRNKIIIKEQGTVRKGKDRKGYDRTIGNTKEGL
jgi:hypothetical protein